MFYNWFNYLLGEKGTTGETMSGKLKKPPFSLKQRIL